MFKNFRDKIALSGVTVLIIGVALLIFTFMSAYGFLTQNPIDPAQFAGIEAIFGGTLGPLIATCIRIMYLGIMGWIGSLITIRGVTLIANAPKLEVVVPQKPVVAQPKPVPQKAKAEPQKEVKPQEAKPAEPEFVVIPPEEIVQPQQQTQQPQNNNGESKPPTS